MAANFWTFKPDMQNVMKGNKYLFYKFYLRKKNFFLQNQVNKEFLAVLMK